MAVPRYFFNVHDMTRESDHEGTELPDDASARSEAVAFAGALLSDNPEHVWESDSLIVDVTNEGGQSLGRVEIKASIPE